VKFFIGNHVAKATDSFVRLLRSTLDGLDEIVSNMGSPTLWAHADIWNMQIGAPVVCLVLNADLDQTRADNLWTGDAATAYKDSRLPQKAALSGVKTVTDGISNALSEMARAIMLRVVGCALLLTMYFLFLAVYALLNFHHAGDASLTLMLITGVAGTISMLGVAVANLWARYSPRPTGPRRLTKACLTLVVLTAVALFSLGTVMAVSGDSLALSQSFTGIIGILTATSPATFTLRALRHREAPAAQIPRRP
jgi:hypothetical protein